MDGVADGAVVDVKKVLALHLESQLLFQERASEFPRALVVGDGQRGMLTRLSCQRIDECRVAGSAWSDFCF